MRRYRRVCPWLLAFLALASAQRSEFFQFQGNDDCGSVVVPSMNLSITWQRDVVVTNESFSSAYLVCIGQMCRISTELTSQEFYDEYGHLLYDGFLS